MSDYRGRLAPSPTGFLHIGHARTFWIAHERARTAGGALVLRNEDLDPARCKPHFTAAMIEDLRWLGLEWSEGPDCNGPFGPYTQTERRSFHIAAFEKLRQGGWIYPCGCSRQDVLRALQAPHAGEEEPVYPGTCRERQRTELETWHPSPSPARISGADRPCHWRFRVPDGEKICFTDAMMGSQAFIAGKDFGDFVVWRNDDIPSYQLAVVVDDAMMRITEVVRGADLILSTARQLLLYRALALPAPTFCHCPLVTDASGVRLAKRHDALSLRTLRERGATPERVRGMFAL